MRTGSTSSTGQTGPKADNCPRVSVGFEGEGEGENGCRRRREWKLVGCPLSSLLIDTSNSTARPDQTYLLLSDHLYLLSLYHHMPTNLCHKQARPFIASTSHCPHRSCPGCKSTLSRLERRPLRFLSQPLPQVVLRLLLPTTHSIPLPLLLFALYLVYCSPHTVTCCPRTSQSQSQSHYLGSGCC